MTAMRRILCVLLNGGHDYYPPYARNWRKRRVCKKCAYVKVEEIR
jgi:hypothetical protein